MSRRHAHPELAILQQEWLRGLADAQGDRKPGRPDPHVHLAALAALARAARRLTTSPSP